VRVDGRARAVQIGGTDLVLCWTPGREQPRLRRAGAGNRGTSAPPPDGWIRRGLALDASIDEWGGEALGTESSGFLGVRGYWVTCAGASLAKRVEGRGQAPWVPAKPPDVMLFDRRRCPAVASAASSSPRSRISGTCRGRAGRCPEWSEESARHPPRNDLPRVAAGPVDRYDHLIRVATGCRGRGSTPRANQRIRRVHAYRSWTPRAAWTCVAELPRSCPHGHTLPGSRRAACVRGSTVIDCWASRLC